MKKAFASLVLFIFALQLSRFVFAIDALQEQYLYYLDRDKNGKIDTLEIIFNQDISGVLNPDKLIIYSQAGGLSSQKLDDVRGNTIFSGSTLSGNTLVLFLHEQDLMNTSLQINNSTSSHLRLKTNAGVGIFGENGSEMKLLYGTSFANYQNFAWKEYIENNEEIQNPNEDTSEDGIDEEVGNENESGTGETLPELPDNSETEQEYPSQDNESGSGNIIPPEHTQDPEIPDEAENNTSTGGIITETPEGEFGSGTVFSGTLLNSKFIFQSPSYILEKEVEKEKYFCDQTQVECRVNFQILLEQNAEFKTPSTQYICEWNFGDSQFDEEKNKCNPNTLILPVGEHTISYKILKKSDNFLVSEKNFIIENHGYITPAPKVVYVGGGGGSSSRQNYDIPLPQIHIQSGIDENGKCKNYPCKVNLEYEIKDEREKCEWIFPLGKHSIGTEKRCNPGIVEFPLGSHEVELKVSEIGNPGNYKTTFLRFVSEKVTVNSKTTSEEKNEENGENSDDIDMKAKIVLQSKTGALLYQNEKNIFCKKSECSLNFDGRESIFDKNTQFFWDFGNGQSFTGSNPNSQKFLPGEYSVFLQLTNGERVSKDEIFLHIGEENAQETLFDEEIIQNYPFEMASVFPNQTGVDREEYIEVFSHKETSLENCELQVGKKAYSIEKYGNIGEKSSKKIFAYDTGFSLKNSGASEIKIVCENQIIDSLSWNFKVPDDFILFREDILKGINQVKANKKLQMYQITFQNGEEKTLPFSEKFSAFDDFSKEFSQISGENKELKKQKLEQFVTGTFYQKVSKQKSGVKISGNTFPKATVLVELQNNASDFSLLFLKTFASETYEIMADSSGYYELQIPKIQKGSFVVKNTIFPVPGYPIPIEKEQELEIDQDYLDYISPEKTEIKPKILQSVITLQGKVSQNKKVVGNKIICFDAKTCSVNFDGRKSTGDKISYFWDFGNGKTFEKSNPGAYNFGAGNHVISLAVSEKNQIHTSYYLVQVIPPLEKIPKTSQVKTSQNSGEKSSIQLGETQTFPLYYHFIYSSLIFFLFLVLSGLILKQRNII